MHVRISETGREILNDRKTAQMVLRTIRENMQTLNNGDKVKVKDSSLNIQLATSIKDVKK